MILITGASGKTGQAIVKQLAGRKAPCRALARRAEQVDLLRQLGAEQVVVGNITEADDLRRATTGVETIYHICPNMHPDEVAIGQKLIDAAQANGVRKIVYHSVLHPQTEEMPHHWNKLRVEEMLFKSGLAYTILQPAAYMQNVLAYRKTMVEQDVYRVPYSVKTRISMVDLDEVAEVAAKVIVGVEHSGAIYELANSEALDQSEVAQTISSMIKRPVSAEMTDRAEWAQMARQSGLSEYAIDTLLRMFEYYERFGFRGNAKVFEMLLGRKPKTFGEWAAEQSWG